MKDNQETPQLRPAAFLDRDGVINVDRGYTFRPEHLCFTPTAVAAIRLLNTSGYLAIVVTNQSGVARGFYDIADVEAFHAHMQSELGKYGARIDAFYYCAYHPDGTVAAFSRAHEDRKPAPGMLIRAIEQWSVDPARSFIIGDNESDRIAGERAGICGLVIPSNSGDLEAAVRSMINAVSAVSKAAAS